MDQQQPIYSSVNSMIGRNTGRSGMNATNGSDFTTPPPVDFNTQEMRGSMQLILSDNIGEFVVIEFLIGTTQIMRKQGILYFVGTSYVTLYDEEANNFIVCDIFSIKFVYFYFPGQRPYRSYNPLPDGNGPSNGSGNGRRSNNR